MIPPSRRAGVGDGVEQSGGSDALALVVDDDGAVVGVLAVIAELDRPIAQVHGGLIAEALEAEGVIFFDGALGLGKEEFVVVFAGKARKRTHARSMPKRSIGFMPRPSWSVAL